MGVDDKRLFIDDEKMVVGCKKRFGRFDRTKFQWYYICTEPPPCNLDFCENCLYSEAEDTWLTFIFPPPLDSLPARSPSWIL